MKRARKTPPFESEVALCAKFIARIGADWTAYPETGGWDILLVRNADGFQIGIQAKLKLNVAVITQAIEDGWSYRATRPGPDCRAVLVPYSDAAGFGRIAGYIGLTIIRVSSDGYGQAFSPGLPRINRDFGEDWFECAPAQRHKLPEYVPDVAAGASAPLRLTTWKIAAIKVSVMLDKRGFVTRHDFKMLGIDYRRWIAVEYGWLKVSHGRYVAGPRLPDFRAQHPRVYDEITADADKWMPIAPPLLARRIEAEGRDLLGSGPKDREPDPSIARDAP